MSQYALGTSKLIASLLVMPDAIALLPNATSTIGWILKLIGLWVSAAVLWFAFFNAVLLAVRLIVGGVTVTEEGVYPWRFGSLIKWENVAAVSVETRKYFSKAFFLKPAVRNLIIFVEKANSERLAPKFFPSFLFKPSEFDRLVEAVYLKKFDQLPASFQGFFCTATGLRRMRSTSRMLFWLQIVVSLLVAFGLFSFIGRKAMVNFAYNYGNRALAEHSLSEAVDSYKRAVLIDPTFAYGWEALAHAELEQNQIAPALADWQKALRLKPDYVEATLWLARYDLANGHLRDALQKLEKAKKLAPAQLQGQAYTLLYRAACDNTMHVRLDAEHQLKILPARSADFTLQNCCQLAIAQTLIRDGQFDQALTGLNLITPDNYEPFDRILFYQLKGACGISNNQHDDAASALDQASVLQKDNPITVNLLIHLNLVEGNIKKASDLLSSLPKEEENAPTTILNQARLDLAEHHNAAATQRLERMTAAPGVSSDALLDAADLLARNGARKSARNAVLKALFMDQDNDRAKALAGALRPPYLR